MRYDQSVRAAKTLLENGTIGEPVFATIEMRGIPHWMPWQKDLGWLTLRIMSIHHLDTFRYWFGDPEAIYCSVRTDPRTKFRHTDGICTYILEYKNGLRCVGIDDTWTGPAKEDCPGDIYIKWRIEGLNGLAIGDIGWCKEPYTTPSTIRYASKGQKHFEAPVWSESWFPDAFIGPMAQLLIALEDEVEPAISGMDNLKTMALVDAAYASASRSRLTSAQEIQHRGEPQAHNQFTPLAQQTLLLARREAERLGHNHIGTEHLMLGLIGLGQGVAINVLVKLGVELETIRLELIKQTQTSCGRSPSGNNPYTPRLKKVLALAAKEARSLNHNFVGTEHLLLGLLREGDGIAARILKSLDIGPDETRKEVLKELDPNFGR
jgi:hypothetical protein